MSKLSTHVLDTTRGGPASGLKIELRRISGPGIEELLWQGHTNSDGRTDEPLLAGDDFLAGLYELRFFVGEYFAAAGQQPRFLSVVPVLFHADPAAGNYHVPLLCSPWSYTTYRGS
jgi:5-hydroxyisourate hydrolase